MMVNPSLNRQIIITLVIGQEAEEIYSLSQDSIQSYAQRLRADFACIKENVYSDNNIPPHYNKLRIKQYLNQYDRVLFLDCDVIISPNTPNIFNLVPENAIGVVNEGALVDRSEAIKQVQASLGSIENWHSDYFNSGMIVVSKLHQGLFDEPETIYLGLFREQSYLNWKARLLRYQIYYLDKQYNYFFHPAASLRSASSAYIVHFAGWGFQLPRTQLDSKHTYKYHQMKCFLKHLAGQTTIRINPEQLYLVSGCIDKKSSLRKFTISQGNLGLISYGPYIKIPDGFYKITINFELCNDGVYNRNKQAIAFSFDVVSNTGNRIWLRSVVPAFQPEFELFVTLKDVEDFEIRFHSTGIPFSLSFIELALIEPKIVHLSSAVINLTEESRSFRKKLQILFSKLINLIKRGIMLASSYIYSHY